MRLNKYELNTIPIGKKAIRGYEDAFKSDKETRDVMFESRSHFEMAKYSTLPQVRERFFKAITQRGANTDLVKELVQIR